MRARTRPSAPCRLRPAVRAVLALGLLSAGACLFPTEPNRVSVPCFTCPPEWTDLWIEGPTGATVGDTVHLRAFMSGPAMVVFVATAPASEARWTLQPASAAAVEVTPATSRDTAALGTARVIPRTAGRLEMTATWRGLVGYHAIEVAPRSAP